MKHKNIFAIHRKIEKVLTSLKRINSSVVHIHLHFAPIKYIHQSNVSSWSLRYCQYALVLTVSIISKRASWLEPNIKQTIEIPNENGDEENHVVTNIHAPNEKYNNDNHPKKITTTSRTL